MGTIVTDKGQDSFLIPREYLCQDARNNHLPIGF